MSTTNLKTAAGRPRQNGVQTAIDALAGGAGTRRAARRARLDEALVADQLRDPDFRREVSEARGALVLHAAGRLARLAAKAADTLEAVLDKADGDAARIAAAKAVLASCPRFREAVELEERVGNLERRARARAEKRAPH